jgi:hypothetical protein
VFLKSNICQEPLGPPGLSTTTYIYSYYEWFSRIEKLSLQKRLTYSSEMDKIPAPKQNAVRRRTAVEKLEKKII